MDHILQLAVVHDSSSAPVHAETCTGELDKKVGEWIALHEETREQVWPK
jgi:adenosyl cobinamide kinase/adenosyl cobinamide phosphate guanylyltransferase